MSSSRVQRKVYTYKTCHKINISWTVPALYNNHTHTDTLTHTERDLLYSWKFVKVSIFVFGVWAARCSAALNVSTKKSVKSFSKIPLRRSPSCVSPFKFFWYPTPPNSEGQLAIKLATKCIFVLVTPDRRLSELLLNCSFMWHAFNTKRGERNWFDKQWALESVHLKAQWHLYHMEKKVLR